jgi:hypothetical protein
VLLRSASLLVEGYRDDLTVHMLAPTNGTLHILRRDGTWETAEFEEDGSYIVFRLPNGGTFAYTEITLKAFPAAPVCIGAGTVLAAALVLLLLLRKRRRKTSAVALSPEEGPEKEENEKPSA